MRRAGDPVPVELRPPVAAGRQQPPRGRRGGVSVGGGGGSIWGTFAGVLAIAAMNSLALLWDVGIEAQRLIVGVAVLAVVVSQSRR